MVGDGTPGTPYRHERAGFEITPPDGWETRVLPGPMVLVALQPSANGFAPNLNVTLGSSTDMLETFVDSEMARAAELLTDLETIERETVTVTGRSGIRVLSRFRQGRFSIALEQWIVEDDAGYVTISAAAEESGWNELRTTIRRVIETFRFVEKP